jgi:hypothetical protein
MRPHLFLFNDEDQEVKRIVSDQSLGDPAIRAVLSDRMEELGRTAEAKLLRSQHPIRYNFNAPGVGPVLTAGEYIEAVEEDAESGLQVLWGETLLGTIEATQRKGVPATSHHWHKEEGETDQSWFRRVFQLQLDKHETVRVQHLLGLACHELLKERQEDEDY